MSAQILYLLMLGYSTQIFALPGALLVSTPMSGHQSDMKPSLAMIEPTPIFNQNKVQQPSSASGIQDQISIDDNSAKASADRIRKIVTAALALRRANKNNDGIAKSKKSLIQNPRTDTVIHPVEISEHTVASNYSPSTIYTKSNVDNSNDEDQNINVPNKSKISGVLIKNAQSPIVSPISKSKIKLHKKVTPQSTSRIIQKSSVLESSVIILPKSMPYTHETNKLLITTHMNGGFETNTSNFTSTSDNMSLSKFFKAPTTEENRHYHTDEHQHFKFISPWNRRTAVGKKAQLDTIIKLVGRHALQLDSEESMETHEHVRDYKDSSEIKPTFISDKHKEMEENIRSSQGNQVNRNKTTNVSKTGAMLQPYLKSFIIDEPKQVITELEENTITPITITSGKEMVEMSTPSETLKSTTMEVDVKKPIHIIDNTEFVDHSQPIETNEPKYNEKLYQVPNDKNKSHHE
ncbi:unnamed protein product, partial [Meganyctiphanes norvegica]